MRTIPYLAALLIAVSQNYAEEPIQWVDKKGKQTQCQKPRAVYYKNSRCCYYRYSFYEYNEREYQPHWPGQLDDSFYDYFTK